MTSFETAIGLLGLLLLIGALLSGLARRSVLSLAALFVLAGFALGRGGAGVLGFDSSPEFVSDLATVVLIVTLFQDGLDVDREFLATQWRLPLRKLVVGMPITVAIIALVAHFAVGLSWLEALLLGAILAPTDPVLSAGVMGDPRVPGVVRHSINLESGLNDGLALPAVLALAAALDQAGDPHFVWWHFALQDIGLGLLYGLACGMIGSLLMPRAGAGRSRTDIPDHQKALYGLGIAFATYSVTVLPPHGNGLIAVFVAAIVLGTRRTDLRDHFTAGAGEIAEIAKLSIFAVFGSLLSFQALIAEGWGAAAVVAATFLLARPLAVLLALARTRLDLPTKLFIGWFGPKGVATIAFSMLIIGRHLAAGRRLFELAALVVFCSIILHGLTDTPGANWMARRALRVSGEAAPAPDASG